MLSLAALTSLLAALRAASAFAVASLATAALVSTAAAFSTLVSTAALLSALFLAQAARPSARTATVRATFFMIVPFPSMRPRAGVTLGPPSRQAMAPNCKRGRRGQSLLWNKGLFLARQIDI